MTAFGVQVVLAWVIVCVAGWLGYRLITENGRVLLRIMSLEHYLRDLQDQVDGIGTQKTPEGLPPGVEAPPFELTDLDGEVVALERFRGRRVLLIFFSPTCNFCRQLAPELAKLARDVGEGRPVPLIIASGEREATQRLVEEHGIRCRVLLQEMGNVAARYGTIATPVAYLVDERGLVASPMVQGASAVLALATAPSAAVNGGGNGAGPAEHADVTFRPEHEPVLLGGGLRRGGLAPNFRLPRLDGGTLSLDAYRGRRLLLVFSDPRCPSCDEIMPEVEKIYRRGPDLQVLMISRGDPELNRAKISELGLTFPVVLQRYIEISRLYRKFSTPAAYLIDENGLLASRVALGGAILELAMKATRPPKPRMAFMGMPRRPES